MCLLLQQKSVGQIKTYLHESFGIISSPLFKSPALRESLQACERSSGRNTREKKQFNITELTGKVEPTIGQCHLESHPHRLDHE